MMHDADWAGALHGLSRREMERHGQENDMAKKSKGKMKGSMWATMLGVATAAKMLMSTKKVLVGLAVAAGALYAYQKLTDD